MLVFSLCFANVSCPSMQRWWACMTRCCTVSRYWGIWIGVCSRRHIVHVHVNYGNKIILTLQMCWFCFVKWILFSALNYWIVMLGLVSEPKPRLTGGSHYLINRFWWLFLDLYLIGQTFVLTLWESVNSHPPWYGKRHSMINHTIEYIQLKKYVHHCIQ